MPEFECASAHPTEVRGAIIAVSRCGSHICEARGMSNDCMHHSASFDVWHAHVVGVSVSLKCVVVQWCHAGCGVREGLLTHLSRLRELL